MHAAIYILCAATAAICSALLLRSYRRGRAPLLFFSGLCFAGLTIENLLLFVERILVPTVDLAPCRTAASLFSVMLLLYGMVWKKTGNP